MSEAGPLWRPSAAAIEAAPLTAFTRAAEVRAGRRLASYRELHAWSVADRAAFWDTLWEFGGVIGERGRRSLADGELMPGASFYPDARLNFAENLLRTDGPGDAIVFRGEDKVETRLSWSELRGLVSRLQQLFQTEGVKPGDRVAAMMPNMPETVAAMLAAASLGAVWSSCSPDFGEQGVLDRFGQIEPVLLLLPDGYWYGGKAIDVADKVRGGRCQPAEPVGGSSSSTISAAPRDSRPRWTTASASARLCRRSRRSRCLSRGCRFPTRSTSSSRRAPPACRNASSIRPAATLLQHLKEHRLHCSLADGRPPVLLHHLRLDDVELAGFGPGDRGDALALRRLALLSRRQRSVRFRRGRADDLVRHLGQIHRCAAKSGLRAGPQPRSVAACARSPRPARRCRRRASSSSIGSIKAGRASCLDLGRHRHHGLFRPRHPDRAGVDRRDPGAGARHGGRLSGTRTAGRRRPARASWSAPKPFRRCR